MRSVAVVSATGDDGLRDLWLCHLRLRSVRASLEEQLGSEALCLGHPLDFESDRVDGFLETVEPVVIDARRREGAV